MNNNKFYMVCIGILLLFSCKKEETGNISNEQSIAELKLLYETNMKSTAVVSASPKSYSNPNVNPRGPKWREAKSITVDKEQIIEIPLTFQYNRGLQNFNNNNAAVSDPEKLNIRKLVFIKRITGKTDIVIMTIVPNSTLIPKYGDFNYKTVPGNFDGLVLFHDIKDNFINGWRYENGKVSKKLSNETFRDRPKTNSEGLSLTDPTHDDCYTVVVTRWCQDCTDWYVNGVYDRTSCGTAYACGQYSYIECPPACTTCGTGGVPPGGGGGSGDSGGSEVSNTMIMPNSEDAQGINAILQTDPATGKPQMNVGYKWKCGSGKTTVMNKFYNWIYASFEVGTLYKDNNLWKFKVLTHSEIQLIGQTPMTHTYRIGLGYAFPNYAPDRLSATMTLNYTVYETINSINQTKSWNIPATTRCIAPNAVVE